MSLKNIKRKKRVKISSQTELSFSLTPYFVVEKSSVS